MEVAAPVKTPLETISLKNAAGDSVTIYPFGACITSYIKNGVDVLMVRPDAKLDGSKPISGGIPHCFPQFGPGAIQQHGFARNVDWDVVPADDDDESSGTKVVFRLKENEYTLAMWPYSFCAEYTVTLTDDALKTEFSVENTGDKPFDFTAALHSYWSISGVENIKITSEAFAGASYLDKTASPPAEKNATGSEVTITKETDSVYAGVSGEVQLVDKKRKRPLRLENYGWSDTVVWNPYGDEGMGYDKFVCVESAQASAPVVLAPGEYWTAALDIIP
jgi:glucose-6-phosphate 1-epimerase